LRLTETQRAEFEALLSHVDLWSPPPATGFFVLDGSTWVLEAVRDHKYGAWVARTPHLDPKFAAYRRLCDYLVALSGLSIPASRYY
jgi:hypothetical protein